jgi:hypothetical protein
LKAYSKSDLAIGQRSCYSFDPLKGFSVSSCDQANFTSGPNQDYYGLYSSTDGTCTAPIEDPQGHLVAIHIETNTHNNICAKVQWDSFFQNGAI